LTLGEAVPIFGDSKHAEETPLAAHIHNTRTDSLPMATQVLLSFSNAGLGSIFATWLRRRIMTAKNLYDARSVYMDNIAMRDQSGTTLTQDTRFKDANAGITLIGASNEQWNAQYLQAMSECSSMIVVATKEWAVSQWCWQEFRQAGQEAETRKHGGFKRVALQFADTDSDTRAKFAAAGWDLIPVEKVVVGGTGVRGDFAEVVAHAGGWVIREADLQQVLSRI
jgi:hypothetical protein